jgi:acylphosphatase
MDATERVQARVVFAGRVQGVGFRYTTMDVAASFDVTGYVRNLRDGTVEMVAEGTRAQVEALVEAVSERMRRYVHHRLVTWEPATGQFRDFDLRFD